MHSDLASLKKELELKTSEISSLESALSAEKDIVYELKETNEQQSTALNEAIASNKASKERLETNFNSVRST